MHKYFHLKKYLNSVEKSIDKAVKGMGEKSSLRDACEFSLKSGGKRFRPILVLLIADALGNGYDVTDAALSSEFFHTASLIADDLPCMDDEKTRRGKPSLHIAFSESTAILTSYTLIAMGYESIHKSAKILANHTSEEHGNKAGMFALSAVSACAGINGATKGQFLDLNLPNNNLDTLVDVIEKKTVTLFEVSCILGWVFGGGDLTKLDEVKNCSYHLGMAFQIADDINDFGSKNDHTNIAQVVGLDESNHMFENHFSSFQKSLSALNLKSNSIDALSDVLWDMSGCAKTKV